MNRSGLNQFKKKLFSWMFLFPVICYGSPVIPDSLSFHIHEQVRLFPQEKIYLHLDKPSYLSGERIWFKAYITDASLHQPITPSIHVYVELIDPFQNVVVRVKVLQQDSIFPGYLDLAETLPEGPYTIRAYTRYMENLSTDHFFTTSIFIGGPLSATILNEVSYEAQSNGDLKINMDFTYLATHAKITPDKISTRTDNESEKELSVSSNSPVTTILPIRQKMKHRHILLTYEWEGKKASVYHPLPIPEVDDFDVSFFPEGGHLLTGVFCTVGFKALNSSGFSEFISGEIFDNEDNKITDFESLHLGMGRFTIMPEKGKQYYAICTTKEGQSKRFDLPQHQPSGSIIQAKRWNDKLALTIAHGNQTGKRENYYLLGHVRGEVQFLEKWDPAKEALMIDKQNFPSGVMHILLLNDDSDILSERLVYCHTNDQAKVTIQWDKSSYKTRDKIKGMIQLTDISGVPLSGHLSVSITDNNDLLPDSTQTLSSYLLLQSDLKGYIEDPNSYFRNRNRRSEVWLDCLMLTQGWRRYAMKEVLKGNYSFAEIAPEKDCTIEGKVQGMVLKKGVSKSQVILSSPFYNFIQTTETDPDGFYKFRVPSFPDSTRFFVQALTKRGGDLVQLVVNERSFPSFHNHQPIHTTYMQKDKQNHYWHKANMKYTQEHGMRHIYLDEIEVTASYQKKNPHVSPLVNLPDVTVTLQDIKKAIPASMQQLITLIPGARVVDDTVTLSGSAGGSAIIMVDGFKIDGELGQIHVQDVAQIDVLKPPRSVIVDSRSIGGVIFITTKRGDEELTDRKKDNSLIIKPLGYQEPLEFYNPAYETAEQKKSREPDLRTTIYWNPNIRSNEEGEANIEYYSADTPSIYTVKIEGVSWDGKIISQRESLEIIY